MKGKEIAGVIAGLASSAYLAYTTNFSFLFTMLFIAVVALSVGVLYFKEEKIIAKSKVEGDRETKFLLKNQKLAGGIVFLIFFVLFLSTKKTVFSALSLAALLFIILRELSPTESDAKTTMRSTAVELLFALDFAMIAWIVITFLLQTSSPLNVVTSCSMLPVLERGDLIILEGGEANAPTFQFNNLDELKEGLKAVIGKCTVSYDGVNKEEVCAKQIIIGGKTLTAIPANLQNDIIVFEPRPGTPGASIPNGIDLVIHRAFAKFTNGKDTYFLTKGDNNLFLDQEGGNFDIVNEKDVKGKVLFRIPYIGYVKLFLFLQLDETPDCFNRLKGVSG